MKNIITTCIIPAAGKGSRWAPVSGYLPKEMLPLIDQPVIDWVIKDAVDSGCSEIIVVINNQKKVIKDYLSKDKNLNKKAKLIFINQDQPLGISHALLLCKEYIKGKPFALALPDLPTLSRVPVLKQLTQAFDNINGTANVISFNNFPTDMLHHYTECLLEQRKDKLMNITHFCPRNLNNKPHHPGNKIRMSGRYILKPAIISSIKTLMDNFNGQEIKEVDALKQAILDGQKVLGLNIEGHTYDTGNPTGYVRANTAFFKKKLSKTN